MTTDLPTLPNMGVLYRCHVVAQILQGFSEGVDGERLTAAMDWALQGKADLGATQSLMRLFAAPHVAALEEGAWQGDPLAEAATEIVAAEVQAAALVEVNAGAHRAAAEAVIAERIRQVSEEGWTPEHDDEHAPGALAYAAANYAQEAGHQANAAKAGRRRDPAVDPHFHSWPWADGWWKPHGGVERVLVKAGALILAELERLHRAKAPR